MTAQAIGWCDTCPCSICGVTCESLPFGDNMCPACDRAASIARAAYPEPPPLPAKPFDSITLTFAPGVLERALGNQPARKMKRRSGGGRRAKAQP